MSQGIKQDIEELVTEIQMSSDNIKWLILEGLKDEIFFSSRDISKDLNLRAIGGCENVLKTIKIAIEAGIKPCSFRGLIDRDYREFLLSNIDVTKEILQTDYHDLELLMFFSNAFGKIIDILCIHEKSKSLRLKRNRRIKKHISKLACQLGRLRYYCQKNQIKISLSELNTSKFINNTLELNSEKLINHINGKNPGKINLTKKDWEKSQTMSLPEGLNNPKFIMNGHDTMAIFSEGLKKEWACKKVSKNINKEDLEKKFQLAYEDRYFEETILYKSIELFVKE